MGHRAIEETTYDDKRVRVNYECDDAYETHANTTKYEILLVRRFHILIVLTYWCIIIIIIIIIIVTMN